MKRSGLYLVELAATEICVLLYHAPWIYDALQASKQQACDLRPDRQCGCCLRDNLSLLQHAWR